MMMVMPIVAFGFSTPDIILILVVALVLFGPKNMPKMARTIGKSMEEFRRAAREIETEIMKEPEPTTPPPPPPPEPEMHPEGFIESGAESAPAETPVPGGEPHSTVTAPVVISDTPVALPPAPAATTPAAVTPPADTTAKPGQPPAEKTPDVKPVA